MANVKPFRGVRYNAKDISRFICPPYDVISSGEKKRLLGLSPHNMVRLELPEPTAKENKYRRSASLFGLWQKTGVLRTDVTPAFYFCEQTFSDHGGKKTRRGFFAALRLENPKKGEVKPHERTLAKPKEDRLKLLRAVRANISPVFGLFHDRNGEIVSFARRLSRTEPLARAKDREGTVHRVWGIDDAAAARRIAKHLEGRNIFIADGHHRYETAWNYSQERKKKGGHAGAEHDYVLVFLCPMGDPGLVIWPTHRVVEAPADFEKRVGRYFDVLGPEKFKKLPSRSPQALLVYSNGKKRTLVVKNKAILARMMPGKCAAYRELGVSILHSLLLGDVPPETITYVKDENEAYRLARERKCLAVIVPPTPIGAVKQIALAGQTMPQKSTYFFPKVATGIVIHKV